MSSLAVEGCVSFRAFQARLEKVGPFPSKTLRQSQCTPDISGCLNPVQAMVSPVHFVDAFVMEGRAGLVDCTAVSAEQQNFLNKRIWSSLNIGGLISAFHLWQPVSNSKRTAKFVF